jgi:predicted metal-binding membrane protein
VSAIANMPSPASLPVRLAWRHPEWWALALSAGAWVLLLRGHAHAHAYGDLLQGWMVMSVAMMLPMVAEPMRLAAERSFWHRRHRAIAGFLAGYLGCWALIGVFVSFVHVPLSSQNWGAAIAFAVAGAWQLTRWKRRALNGCHRSMPLAPRGWRADRDCIRFGAMIGTRCIVSCWALMLACFFSGHAIVATLLVTGVGFVERYTRRRPDQRLLSGVLFAASVIYAVLAM